jgi:hypothetical protein
MPKKRQVVLALPPRRSEHVKLDQVEVGTRSHRAADSECPPIEMQKCKRRFGQRLDNEGEAVPPAKLYVRYWRAAGIRKLKPPTA